MAALGLCCCAWASDCSGFSCCGAQAQLLCGMWGLPGAGLELVSPASAGRFLTTAPPGKSETFSFDFRIIHVNLDLSEMSDRNRYKSLNLRMKTIFVST